MGREKESAVSLDARLSGFPEGSVITLDVPDTNSTNERKSVTREMPTDTDSDCVANDVELQTEYAIPGEGGQSRLELDSSSSECADELEDGSNAFLFADVHAGEEYRFYETGDWMYGIDVNTSVDSTTPNLVSYDLVWDNGQLIVNISADDTPAMPTYAIVDYRQDSTGEQTSGIVFDSENPVLEGNSQFYEVLNLENYDPNQELEVRVRVGDRAHNTVTSSWQVLESQ